MKQAIIFILFTLAFYSCKNADEPESDLLELSLQDVRMNYNKDASLIIINAVSEWTVNKDAEWIHLSTYEGDGKTGFIIGADENKSFSRQAVVSVVVGDKSKKINVFQSANPRFDLKIKNETIKFVLVDSGSFMIGNNHHWVSLSEYYISDSEITNAVWKSVLETLPKQIVERPDLPVSNVSWNSIVADFLPETAKLTGVSLNLPTEAQWEFAARGGTRSQKFMFSGSNNLDEIAWYFSNSSDRKHFVKTKLPNELGIYDMSGNLTEWCSDWYDEQYGLSAVSATDTIYNPSGKSSGERKVLKGGNFSNGEFEWYDVLKCTQRDGLFPTGYELAADKINYFDVTDKIGFRLVYTKQQK